MHVKYAVPAALCGLLFAAWLPVPAAADALSEGWVTEANGRYFYRDGEALTGEQVIDGVPYLFAPNGRQQTGWQTVAGQRRYYDREGQAVTGWLTWCGAQYYIDEAEGKRADVSLTLDDEACSFDQYGVLQAVWTENPDGSWHYTHAAGTVLIDGLPYCFDDAGVLLTGWQTAADGITRYYDPGTRQIVSGWLELDGQRYYTDARSGRRTGRQTIAGQQYCFDENGAALSGFVTDENGVTRCYSSKTYTMYTGAVMLNGSSYYFLEDGAMQTGFVTREGSTYHYDSHGRMSRGMVTLEDGTRYFDADGVMQTGWIVLGKIAYYAAENGAFLTGWQEIGDARYCFRPDGRRYTGATQLDEGLFFFDENGVLLTDCWQTLDGKLYYPGADGRPLTGLQTLDDTQYYFDETGARCTGTVLLDEVLYLFGEDGAVTEAGWQTVNGQTYYLTEEGTVQTDWLALDDSFYFFGEDGAMAVSTTIGDFVFAEDGTARTTLAVTADKQVAKTKCTPESVFQLCVSTYTYAKTEATRTFAQLEAQGWDELVRLTLAKKRGVCYYLAAVYDFFMQRAGYETRIIHAVHNTGDHYWVQVKVDDVWQTYDPTYSKRCNISWSYQISLGNYRPLGIVTTHYDARGFYEGCEYTPWDNTKGDQEQ